MPKRPFSPSRALFRGALVLLLAVLVVACAGFAWLRMPLRLSADRVDFVIEQGSSMRGVARQVRDAGIPVHPDLFAYYVRAVGLDRLIKAGGYEIVRGDSLLTLLNRLTRGDVSQRDITLIEGWSLRQMRAALQKDGDLRHTLEGIDDTTLAARLGAFTTHPEGLFFPDTYVFSPGSTDLDILRRAFKAQQRELARAWALRSPDLPFSTPYEALILASIIEKETGQAAERARIAGVFVNRLRSGMPLQTDPSVIYGLGEAFDGNIRRSDLRADTPWNTYTRNGLPPTPISNPGAASLMAAVQPEKHRYFYFVSRGNGTSEFSETLDAHNRQVARYQLGRSATSR